MKVTVLPDVRNISNQKRVIFVVVFLFLGPILTTDFQTFYFQSPVTILIRSMLA